MGGHPDLPTGGHDSPRRSLVEMPPVGRIGTLRMPRPLKWRAFEDAHDRRPPRDGDLGLGSAFLLSATIYTLVFFAAQFF